MYRLLHLLPKNLVSHLLGKVVHSRLPFGIHTAVRDWFIKTYKVDVSDAEFPVPHYPTLGDFFVRRLKPGARPLAASPLISPVDGTLTQTGRFQGGKGRLTQIKGLDYSLEDLAGPGWDLSDYAEGGFLTIYLAPYNYHRIHSPVQGKVSQVGYIPGALWPVNTWSVSHIPGLFVVNERISVELVSPQGKLLLFMVGATNVGRITLDFHEGMIGNNLPRPAASQWRPSEPLELGKGQGLGCFELGSTVILVLSKSWMESLSSISPEMLPRTVRMGQDLGGGGSAP